MGRRDHRGWSDRRLVDQVRTVRPVSSHSPINAKGMATSVEPLPALTKALAGIAVAGLLVTIAFLIVAPHVVVGTTEVNCGTPALWYIEDRKDQATDDLRTISGGAPIPSCHVEIDHRLTSAGISALATVGALGIAALATVMQTQRLRREWEASIRRNETVGEGGRRGRRAGRR